MKRIVVAIAIFIILLVITLKLINTNTENVLMVEKDLQNHTYSLEINNKGNNVYSRDNEDILYKYKNIMIPMDNVFSVVFTNYDRTLETQTLEYGNSTLEIKKEENIITVPNIYEFSESTVINDTVDVEIEEFDGVKYIPIYLLTSISGIEVTLDGKQVYDKDNYYNSIQAIDDTKIEHNIEIKLNENVDDEETSLSSTEYIGEEDGALWREEALKRIEKYRKSDTDIIVKNQNEQILENANVNIKMISNEFEFGTAIRYSGADNFNGITKKLFSIVGSENSLKWQYLESTGMTRAQNLVEKAVDEGFKIRGALFMVGLCLC